MTSRSLVWTIRALADLEAIGEHIAADNPGAAERWVEALLHTSERAARLPFSGRCVPELARQDVREVLKRSYRIIYRVFDDRVDVLTVFEGHRQIPSDLLDPNESTR